MSIPTRFAALADEASARATSVAIINFLEEIWDYRPATYKFLYTRKAGSDHMLRHRIRRGVASKITEILESHPPEANDVYFCPNAFDGPSNKQAWALPTRYAWSDIDDADPKGFKPKPNVLWETSKGRYQGLWLWPDRYPSEVAQQFSRNLWRQFGGDKGAWSANKLLRVPGTINHKPGRDGAFVRLLRFKRKSQAIPKAIADLSDLRGRNTSATSIDPFKHDPKDVILKYGRAVGAYVRVHMTADRLWPGERSGKVFLIIRTLMEVGANDDEIASVVRVNIYFKDKWGEDFYELERQIHKIRGDWEAEQ